MEHPPKNFCPLQPLGWVPNLMGEHSCGHRMAKFTEVLCQGSSLEICPSQCWGKPSPERFFMVQVCWKASQESAGRHTGRCCVSLSPSAAKDLKMKGRFRAECRHIDNWHTSHFSLLDIFPREIKRHYLQRWLVEEYLYSKEHVPLTTQWI